MTFSWYLLTKGITFSLLWSLSFAKYIYISEREKRLLLLWTVPGDQVLFYYFRANHLIQYNAVYPGGFAIQFWLLVCFRHSPGSTKVHPPYSRRCHQDEWCPSRCSHQGHTTGSSSYRQKSNWFHIIPNASIVSPSLKTEEADVALSAIFFSRFRAGVYCGLCHYHICGF